MKVRITSLAEFDRHDSEVRFVAMADGRAVSVSITTYALFIIGEALEMPRAEPLVTYAASGRNYGASLLNTPNSIPVSQHLSPNGLTAASNVHADRGRLASHIAVVAVFSGFWKKASGLSGLRCQFTKCTNFSSFSPPRRPSVDTPLTRLHARTAVS